MFFCTFAVYWALLVHVAAILILKSASLHRFVDIYLFSYNLDDFSCAPSAQTYFSSSIKLKHASVRCFLFVDFDMASFSLHCAHCKRQTENFDHTSYMIHSYLSIDISYLDEIVKPNSGQN
ncbi:hypothetical protein T07_4036 [Trichinella nelsoni]|uniref:Uncharacterized protein n=1 Tax=Trichinella nelsoni TaxID=6336 RepID=A0A0V0S4Y7_9BILA|nr:hypothetical protein T07_4036 [Trichinella nelsoni]